MTLLRRRNPRLDSVRVRRPTPAEMGDELTIAMVALTSPMDRFVCVADQMISYDDTLPADDGGLIKAYQLTQNWSVTFAGNKIANVVPVLDKVRSKIQDARSNLPVEQLQAYFTASIAEMIRNDFFNRNVARYGYPDMEAFRQEGQSNLGNHFFDLCRELDQSDLGVEFIVYGYGHNGHEPHIFAVNGHGETSDHMATRYAVIGSGYWMASASLKRKVLTSDFHGRVYRLLEAKFSAETATGVGKRTTVMIKRRDMNDFVMSPGEIEKIRTIWEAEMRKHEPQAAMDIAGELEAVIHKHDKQMADLRPLNRS